MFADDILVDNLARLKIGQRIDHTLDQLLHILHWEEFRRVETILEQGMQGSRHILQKQRTLSHWNLDAILERDVPQLEDAFMFYSLRGMLLLDMLLLYMLSQRNCPARQLELRFLLVCMQHITRSALFLAHLTNILIANYVCSIDNKPDRKNTLRITKIVEGIVRHTYKRVNYAGRCPKGRALYLLGY